jgi:hypothetical protein
MVGGRGPSPGWNRRAPGGRLMTGTSTSRGRSRVGMLLAAAFLLSWCFPWSGLLGPGAPWAWADDEPAVDEPAAVAESVDEPATAESDASAEAEESAAELQPAAEPDPFEGTAEEPVSDGPIDTADTEAVESPSSHRIRIKLDVAGEIFAPAGRDVPPVRRPIAVDARFDFVETGSIEPGCSVTRRYRDATADVRVENAVRTTRLPSDARRLRTVLEGATPVPSLDTGFLTREELDLLETPFDPLLLGRLLPEKPVSVGDSWTVSADAVAGLLAIDTVESGDLDAKLVDVVDGRGEVKLAGIIDGAADGVPTHVVVEGACGAAASEVDGGVRLGDGIANLAVTIRERREASHVAPGFDVEARLTVARVATEERAELGGESADHAGPEGRRRGTGRPGFVWQRDAVGRYDLVHDARWRTIEDGPNGLVMRFVDRGALVAQCSITSLPRSSSQSPPTIAEVERDLQRSLAGQFGRLEHSSEATRSDGVRLVRVVATGRADGLPFRWIHYVLTDADGDRVAATCTLEDSLEKRFGTADRELVDGIRLPAAEETGSETAGDEGSGPDRQARLPQESRTP